MRYRDEMKRVLILMNSTMHFMGVEIPMAIPMTRGLQARGIQIWQNYVYTKEGYCKIADLSQLQWYLTSQYNVNVDFPDRSVVGL